MLTTIDTARQATARLRPMAMGRSKEVERAPDPLYLRDATEMLVLLARRCRRFGEWPHAVLELENDHSSVLARRPNRAATCIEM